MSMRRGWPLIGGIVIVLAQIQVLAWVGLVLPGCDATTPGCSTTSDCAQGSVCDTETDSCVPNPVGSGSPDPTPSGMPSGQPPGPGGSGLRCAVEPSQGRIPIDVTLSVDFTDWRAGDSIYWDLGLNGSVDAPISEGFAVSEPEINRPLRLVRGALLDSAASLVYECEVPVNFYAPDLEVECSAVPATGRKPLDVELRGVPNGCIGPCRLAWDFGDGSPPVQVEPARAVQHTYAAAGDYSAQVLLTDAVTGEPGYLQRGAVCQVDIEVSGGPGPLPSPSSSPPPPGNLPPQVVSVSADPVDCAGTAAFSMIQCQVYDPDGDAITVTASASPPNNVTLTPPSVTVTGGSGTATFSLVFDPASPQALTITCTPQDSQGLAGEPSTIDLNIPCGAP
jgi:PKD domain